MVADTPTSVFSIPFRYLWNTSFAGDLEIHGEQKGEIARFVGDHPNRDLRLFSKYGEIPTDDFLGPGFWPITLYGSSGTGKTSLALTIIGNLTHCQSKPTDEFDECRPIVLSSPDFGRRFQAAVDTDSVTDFRQRIIQSNGLVIDDIHKLSGKLNTQKELLHLLDQRKLDNRPIIFTADRDPNLLEDFLPQLGSRLVGGLCLPVRAPGEEARRVIVRDLCRINRLNVSPEGQDFIVHRMPVTVPKIVAFMIRLRTVLKSDPEFSKSKKPIEVEYLKRLFNCSQEEVEKLASIVVDRVASEFKIRVSDLSSDSRKRTIVEARAVAIYLQRKLLGLTFQRIGRFFGNRDHSTMIHAFRKIANSLENSDQESSPTNDALSRKINQVEKDLSDQFAGKIHFS